MIELPEVVTLARQMDAELRGKRVESAVRGNTPHKWVWYNREAAEYEGLLAGATVTGVMGDGKWVCTSFDNGLALLFGDMGGRALFHRDPAGVPKKHHLLLRFEDGSAFSIAIQGWGLISLLEDAEVDAHWLRAGVSPIGEGFTYERFREVFDGYELRESGSAKAFLVQRPKITGIGNGYVQDILFRAGIHPTRKVRDLGDDEARRLYDGIRETLFEAIRRNGRDTERDLYGEPGEYQPVLDKRALGTPCRECGTPIEKIAYLGGSCYFCPRCQE